MRIPLVAVGEPVLCPRIDQHLEGIELRLIDKKDHQTLQDRVKTRRIAALMTAVGVWLKAQFFGQ